MSLFMNHRRRIPGLSLIAVAVAFLSACNTREADYPVAPVPQYPRTVSVSFCPGTEPAWAAFQDGDGVWTRADAAIRDGQYVYERTFTTGRGGMATVRQNSSVASLSIFYGTPAELASTGFTRAMVCGAPSSKTLLGSVAGLDSAEAAVILGFQTRAVTTAARGTFELRALPSGPRDLVAARLHRVDGHDDVTRFILRRDVDLPDSAEAPVFDFGSAESFTPASATLTIGGMGAEAARASVRFISGTSDILLVPLEGPSLLAVRPYVALPADRLRAGDLQELFVSTVNGAASRSVATWFTSVADRALTLPAPMARPTFDVVATEPSLRFRARFETQADYDRSTSITYQQGGTQVSVAMTAAYAGGYGYDLVVPDLTGTEGFSSTWALNSGSSVLWIAARQGGTLAAGADAVAVAGSTQRIAFDSDSLRSGQPGMARGIR